MPGKGFKNPESQEKAQHSKALKRTQLKRASQPANFVLPPYEDMPTIPPGVQQGKLPDISEQPTIQHATPDFLNLPGISGELDMPTPKRLAAKPVAQPIANIASKPHPVPPQQPMPMAPLPPIGTPPPPPAETLMTQQVPAVTPSGPLPRQSEVDPRESQGIPIPHDALDRAPDLIARGYTPEERAADLIAKNARGQSSSPNIGMILILGELLIFANVLVSGQMASMLGKLWQAPSYGTQAVSTDASIKPIILEFIGLQAFLLVLVLLARLNRGMYSFSMTFILGVWAVWILFVLPDAIKSNSWNNTINALFPNTGTAPQTYAVPSQGTPSQQQNKAVQKNIGSGRIDPVSTKYESGYYTMNGRY